MANLTKEEVIEQLVARSIPFDPAAKYNDLRKMLREPQPVAEEAAPLETVQPAVEAPKEETKPTPAAEEKKAVAEIVNPFFSFEGKQPMTGKAQEMKKKLMHEHRVPVLIPLGHEELIGSTHQITLNGYTMFIRKGIMVEVPVSVAEVIEAKFRHQLHVRQHPLKIGGVEDIKLKKFD